MLGVKTEVRGVFIEIVPLLFCPSENEKKNKN